VNIFKKSPTKNDAILQTYVKCELGKELSLVLDCCTRWNSLSDMLARFLQLHTAVQKATIDLKEPVQLVDADFAIIKDIVSSLEPVKLAVKALCRRDTNIITAESALNFCIVQLQKQSLELAKTLASSLEDRLRERCALHAEVLQYLHCPSSRSTATELFSIPSNAVIKKFVYQLYVHLEHTETDSEACEIDTSATGEAQSTGDDAHNTEEDTTQSAHSADSDATAGPSLEQQLELAIKQLSQRTPSVSLPNSQE